MDRVILHALGKEIHITPERTLVVRANLTGAEIAKRLGLSASTPERQALLESACLKYWEPQKNRPHWLRRNAYVKQQVKKYLASLDRSSK